MEETTEIKERYYKAICEEKFVGIATSKDLREYQSKHAILLVCDESKAQYIQIGDNIYHAMWMVPETVKGLYPVAEVIEIDEQEYETIKHVIDSEGGYEEPEPPVEEPEPDIPVNPDDNTEITLEYVKEKKIATMSKTSENVIHAGADIALSDGNTYHFSFSDQDQYQIGFLATAAKTAFMLESMGMPTGETGKDYPWHSDGGDCIFYSREDMILIGTAMQNTITYQNSYFHALRNYIQSLEDIQDVVAVEYGMEVPEEYWGDVYADIMNATQ